MKKGSIVLSAASIAVSLITIACIVSQWAKK